MSARPDWSSGWCPAAFVADGIRLNRRAWTARLRHQWFRDLWVQSQFRHPDEMVEQYLRQRLVWAWHELFADVLSRV